MKKYYLNGNEVDLSFAKKLEKNKSFKLVNFKEDLLCNKFYYYEFRGRVVCGDTVPLLCRVSNNRACVYSPYDYSGSYKYNSEDRIWLHSTHGRFEEYRKLEIFGVPFMVCSSLSDEDAVLAAETDKHFIASLIEAL